MLSEGGFIRIYPDRREAHQRVSYNACSLWDAFRAEHPWLQIMAHQRVDDMVTALAMCPATDIAGMAINMAAIMCIYMTIAVASARSKNVSRKS